MQTSSLVQSTSSTVSRRSLLGGLAAAGAGGSLALSGCGNDGSGSDDGNVVFWTISSFAPTADNELKKALESAQEELGFGISMETFSPGDFRDRLITAVQGGTGPDVASADSAWMAQLAASGVATDISEQWSGVQDQFLEGAAQTAFYDGKQYGVPWYTNNVALYYNKSHFSDAGIAAPPANWEEFLTAAKELTGGDRHGFMLGADWLGSFLYWPFLWQAGGEILSEDLSKAAFDGDAGQEAWNFYANLFLTESVVPPTITAVRNGWDEYWTPFMQEKVSMMMVGDWALSAIAEGAPDLDLGLAPLPEHQQAATVVGGYNLVIPSAAKSQENAWKLVDWLSGKDRAPMLASYSRISAHKDASPEGLGEEYQVFKDQASVAKARPVIADWTPIEVHVAESWDKVLQKQLDPSAALKAAAEATNATLGQ